MESSSIPACLSAHTMVTVSVSSSGLLMSNLTSYILTCTRACTHAHRRFITLY